MPTVTAARIRRWRQQETVSRTVDDTIASLLRELEIPEREGNLPASELRRIVHRAVSRVSRDAHVWIDPKPYIKKWADICRKDKFDAD